MIFTKLWFDFSTNASSAPSWLLNLSNCHLAAAAARHGYCYGNHFSAVYNSISWYHSIMSVLWRDTRQWSHMLDVQLQINRWQVQVSLHISLVEKPVTLPSAAACYTVSLLAHLNARMQQSTRSTTNLWVIVCQFAMLFNTSFHQ